MGCQEQGEKMTFSGEFNLSLHGTWWCWSENLITLNPKTLMSVCHYKDLLATF